MFVICPMRRAALALFVTGASWAATSQAALLQGAGPSASVAFDSTLSTAALIYDYNYFSATEGRLVILATGTSLRGPGVPTATAPFQSYLGSGDTLRDAVIQMRINNSTGALVSGSVSAAAALRATASGISPWGRSRHRLAFR